MSKKRNIERAEKEGLFRDGQRGPAPAPKDKQWIKCIYPPCKEQVLIETPSPIISTKPKQTTLPMCPIHGEMCMFMMWLLPQLKVQHGVTPQGIVIPGQPGAATPPHQKLVP